MPLRKKSGRINSSMTGPGQIQYIVNACYKQSLAVITKKKRKRIKVAVKVGWLHIMLYSYALIYSILLGTLNNYLTNNARFGGECV